MQRLLKRLLVILLIIAVLVPAAPRPAHAFTTAVLIAAVAVLVNGVVDVVKSGVIAKAALDEIKIQLKTAIDRISTLLKLKQETAKMETDGAIQTQATIARVAIDNLPNPKKNVCRSVTGARREIQARGRMGEILETSSRRGMMGDFGMIADETDSTAGSGGGGPAGGGSGSTNDDESPAITAAQDPNVTALKKADTYCETRPEGDDPSFCESSSAGAGPAGQASGGGNKKKAAKAIKYPNADISAATLLGGDMFEDAAQARMAGLFCNNITSNINASMPRGKEITGSIENAASFMYNISEIAILQQSRMLCDLARATRSPPPSKKFPNGDFMPRILISPERFAVYSNLKHLGWSEADPVRIARGWNPAKPSLAQNQQYNPSINPSLRLHELASIGRTVDPNFFKGLVGSVQTGLKNLITVEALTLRQKWREYELMEQQVLTKAIMLSRKTRQRSGQL